MFRCHVCGSIEARKELVSEVFQIDGQMILVERIPAAVCARCGEAVFSRETTETVRKLAHRAAHPIRSVQMDVFALA